MHGETVKNKHIIIILPNFLCKKSSKFLVGYAAYTHHLQDCCYCWQYKHPIIYNSLLLCYSTSKKPMFILVAC